LQTGSLPRSYLPCLFDQLVVDCEGQVHTHSLRVHLVRVNTLSERAKYVPAIFQEC
jgi:hypothetical protein